jgi:hypothetical protein
VQKVRETPISKNKPGVVVLSVSYCSLRLALSYKCEILPEKYLKKAKWAGGMDVMLEHLTTVQDVLSSNPSITPPPQKIHIYFKNSFYNIK